MADLTARMVPFLQGAGVLPADVSDEQRALLAEAAPLVHERMTTLADSVDMVGFLFVDDATFERDPADVAKLLDEDGRGVVKAARDALAGLERWDTPSIERGAAGVPRRRPRAQAAQRLRAGAGRDHRTAGVTAAVRVDGAARPGPVAGPARQRPAGLSADEGRRR